MGISLESSYSTKLQHQSRLVLVDLMQHDPHWRDAATGHINDSLQALINWLYLLAREASPHSELQPLIIQTQAEVARLSRWIQKLGSDGRSTHSRPHARGELK